MVPLQGILVSEAISCFLSARHTSPLYLDQGIELRQYAEILHERSKLAGLFDEGD
jgi:hypothetical protein